MRAENKIESPFDPRFNWLGRELRRLSDENNDAWPAEQLTLCGRLGVFSWFFPRNVGGLSWSETDIVKGYLHLSASCLTTTFVITQFMAAARRIAGSDNEWLKHQLLSALVHGNSFSTVGISHLTTSRQHVGRSVLMASVRDQDYVLDGYCPWVTGAIHTSTIVVGATMDDQRQILIAVPTDTAGLTIPPRKVLVGLTGSETGPVNFDAVHVNKKWLVDGPEFEVMKLGRGTQTGGLQTSTLAVGLATTALSFLIEEAVKRDELRSAATCLEDELNELTSDLLESAEGKGNCTAQDIRTRANSLVLRITQAALAAAKGNGYVWDHPAGRWCREALFFLVWSCPQPVVTANLCELAGIAN
jgi:alkylation response protein AidB-like acyl-CoA dehydrogenase